jgi:membrane protease YdiL (CAAX protease family)
MDSLVPSVQSPAEARPPSGLLVRFARKRPIVSFFALAYLLGWAAVSPRVLFYLGLVSFDVPNWWIIVAFYAPCIAGLCMQWLTEGNLRVCRFYDSGRSFLLGIIIGPALILISFVVLPALLAEKAPLRTLNWHAFVSLTSYHLQYSVFLGTIGEEPGWRGYALPRMQARLGPVWASALLGFLWAGWQFPGLLISLWSVTQMLTYSVGLIALSVLMTFAANLSRFSIVVAVIMHNLSSMNPYLIHELKAHSHARSHWYWVGVISNLLVPAVVVLLTRGRLGMTTSSPSNHRQLDV